MTKAVESSLDEAKKHGWNGRFNRAIMNGAHACLSCLWCVAGEGRQIVTHYITYVVRGRRATDDATPSAPPPRTAPARLP